MSSELLVVAFNGKFGFINRAGKLVIPLQYASAGWFSEGLARVLIPGEKNRFAFIDESGAIVFEPRWGTKRPEFCSVMSDGMVQVGFKAKKGTLTGYFTRTGELAIKPQYEFMSRSFENGIALVEDVNGKKRFIDKTGATRFGDFDYASNFSEGMAKVGIKLKSGFIDSQGRRVIPIEYTYVDDFSDGLAVFEGKSGKHGYLDKKGNVVIPPTLNYALSFKEGLAAVRFAEQYGYIDKTGKRAFETLVDSANTFSEGLCAAQLGEKWGYIDRKGCWVIKPRFDEAESFSQGRAVVKIRDKAGVIDTKGNFIVEPSFTNIHPYGENTKDLAMASRYGKATPSLETWLDLDGKPLWMPDKSSVSSAKKSEAQKRGKSADAEKGLSEKVKKELNRLGAMERKKPSSRTMDLPIDDLTEAARALLLDYDWPKKTTYGNDGDKYDQHVWMVDFNYTPTMVTENEDIDDRRILMFAIADGGNYMLCLDLDDKTPSDPHVYAIDHYEAFNPEVDDYGTLSKFLSQLEKESKQKK